jgi:hypothetical protein
LWTFQQQLHIKFIRYSRAYASYQDFFDRGLLLTWKLLVQGFLLVKLKSSLRKLYCRHHDLVNVMECLWHKWPRYVPLVVSTSRFFPHAWLITGFATRLTRRVTIVGQEQDYHSGPPEFTPGFEWVSCYSIFSFMCMFCRSLIVLLFFFRPLCCLFFFDIRILITHLVSSDSSYIWWNDDFVHFVLVQRA